MGSLEPTPAVVVYAGEDKSINIGLKDQVTYDPFDLTSASEIVAILAGTAAPVEKRKTTGGILVLNAGGGRISLVLTPTDTLALVQGASQPIELRITINALTTYVQIPNALSVQPSLFPTV